MGDNCLEIPGTAQIRKITTYMSSMELLLLCEKMAAEGLSKKLWSVLSRVFEDKKGFEHQEEAGMAEAVASVLSSDIPEVLKLQLFTSFQLPESLLPNEETLIALLSGIDKKRSNIAAYFIDDYGLELKYYDLIRNNPQVFEVLVRILSESRLIAFYTYIFENEKKEVITGDIRTLGNVRQQFHYKDIQEIQKLTDLAFQNKEVFFSSKLLYCLTFKVPVDCVKNQKDLYKILRISINYEERIAKQFVKEYKLNFDVSDLAICKIYLANKKSQNQRNLVNKFAVHLSRVEKPEDRTYLLRGAFKRGGYFRLYAGCMQDGYVDMNKMKRFKYSDEDVAWVKSLPGLKTE